MPLKKRLILVYRIDTIYLLTDGYSHFCRGESMKGIGRQFIVTLNAKKKTGKEQRETNQKMKKS